MNRLLKWLLYLVSVAVYLWAVFVWDRFPVQEELPGMDQLETLEEESSTTTDSTVAEVDSVYYPETPVDTEEPVEPDLYDLPIAPYLVIGGSFEDKERAEQEQQRLNNLYVPSSIGYITPYYRLILGAYGSQASARSAMLDMRALGIDAYVHQQE